MPDFAFSTPKQARVRSFEEVEGLCTGLDADREREAPPKCREDDKEREKRRASHHVEKIAGDFCLQTRQNILGDELLHRLAADFEEMLSPCGGKFTE